MKILENQIQECETFQEAYDMIKDEFSEILQTESVKGGILKVKENALEPQQYCNLAAALEENAMSDTIYTELQKKAEPEILIPKEELTKKLVSEILEQSDLVLDKEKLVDKDKNPVPLPIIPDSVHDEIYAETVKAVETTNQNSVCVFLPREVIDDIKEAGNIELIETAAKGESFGEDQVLVMNVDDAKSFAQTAREVETPDLANTIDKAIKEHMERETAEYTNAPAAEKQTEHSAHKSRQAELSR